MQPNSKPSLQVYESSMITSAVALSAGLSAAPNMQLVLAALSVLLGRAQAYLAGPLASALASSVQRLAAAGQQATLQPASAVSLHGQAHAGQTSHVSTCVHVRV